MGNFSFYLHTYIEPFAIKLAIAAAIYFIGKMVISVIMGLIKKGLKKTGKDETLSKFVLGIISALLTVFLYIAVLDKLGVNTASFAAIIAAAGFAVGFALKDSLGNFASGVMIIIFAPFKVGDVVNAGGTFGVVEEVGIFVTIIKTLDNQKVLVPNGKIMGDTITNVGAYDTRRVDMTFGIGYDDDIELAKKTILDILAADDKVLKNPAPQVELHELADSSMNFVVRPWCKTSDYWDVYFRTTKEVKFAFDKANISIPYPQMDLHMIKS